MITELIETIFKEVTHYEKTGDEGNITDNIRQLRRLVMTEFPGANDIDYKMLKVESFRKELFSSSEIAKYAAVVRNALYDLKSTIELRLRHS